MGLTIRGPHVSIDVPYGGFARLRRTVAGLVGEEVGAHYEELFTKELKFVYPDERKAFFDRHDAETKKLYERSSRDVKKAIEFLYAPDCDGSASYGTCAALLRIVGDYDDDKIYGYAGWKRPAKFADFVAVLRDCADSKRKMKWS